ncbi:MAG: hypothetical protein LBS96_05435 [Oscillospiraceae bacterium]|jgi:hypothetical protein|nr:hypothetical protein [Oscillospiraceae bacterium]
MFEAETPRELMNFFEGFLFDISEKFVGWVENTFTEIAITDGLNNFVDSLKGLFGERNVAYAFVDLLAFIGELIQKLG